MDNDIIEVIQERLKMLRERELLCADECRVLRVLVEEIEQEYIKLPVDADGVPIRPGDMLENIEGIRFEVYSLEFYKDGLTVRSAGGLGMFTDVLHHVKPETIESVLEEYRACVLAENPSIHNNDVVAAVRKEYAERIKKVGS